MRSGIGEANRRYSRMINQRENWKGHLRQGRFASFPLDENYLLAAARYIEMNPVRAGLVREPWFWPWSSAGTHLAGLDDELVKVSSLLEIVGDWRHYLTMKSEEEQIDDLRKHERTGRPLGDREFVEKLETKLNRPLRRRKPGLKKEANN